jgi:prevent-host-death family protein
MSQVMKATEVRVHFGEVMRRVSKGGSPIIVERAGQPLVAIISLTDHDRLERLQAGSNVRAALERARAARQRIQKERAGQPLPNPTEVLRQVSEERVEQLSSLDR